MKQIVSVFFNTDFFLTVFLFTNIQQTHSLKLFQLIYRQNPIEFYKFIIKSKLYPFILWTESKRIVQNLKLKNIARIVVSIRFTRKANRRVIKMANKYIPLLKTRLIMIF